MLLLILWVVSGREMCQEQLSLEQTLRAAAARAQKCVAASVEGARRWSCLTLGGSGYWRLHCPCFRPVTPQPPPWPLAPKADDSAEPVETG